MGAAVCSGGAPGEGFSFLLHSQPRLKPGMLKNHNKCLIHKLQSRALEQKVTCFKRC